MCGKGGMTKITDRAGPKPFGPPLRRGLPLLLLCELALAYAYIAIPPTLIPHFGSLNVFGKPTGNDFLAFYSSALLAWRHSAADVFDLSRLLPFQDALSGTTMHLPFSYPPHFLLLMAPLASMPYLPALYVWIAATSAPFVVIVRKFSGLAAPIIVLAPPLIQNAIDGQNGALTASLFAGGLMLLANRRPALAGLVFGLLTFKPQVFILIPVCLVAARQYRALATLVATGVFLLLCSIAAFGIEIWWKFLEYLPQQMSFVFAGRLPVARCPTLFMLVFHATGNLALANVAQAFSTLAALALVAWSWRRTSATFPRALAFCVAMPLSTPYMLEYDLAVWTLPAAILLMRLWRGEGAAPDWIALPVLWLLPSLAWLMSLADLNLAALVVLSLAPYAIWSVRREPSPPPARATGALIAAPA
jgi:hypothetical protein